MLENLIRTNIAEGDIIFQYANGEVFLILRNYTYEMFDDRESIVGVDNCRRFLNYELGFTGEELEENERIFSDENLNIYLLEP